MTESATPAIAGGVPIRSVPLPYARHSLDDIDIAAVTATLRSDHLTGGPAVEGFEYALADACGVEHAVAVCNGTAALHIAYAALGVDSQTEVVVPPLTFVATANAARFLGATVRFGDIGPDRCLDAQSIRAAVTASTRAVVTVDYAGLPSDTEALRGQTGDLPIVVDAAHSLGGSVGGKPVGSLGTITSLSFHPVKQVTTGEGGACVTDDAELASHMRRLRNHAMTSTAEERSGQSWRYDCTELGYNYRLTDIGAALGHAQLQRLPNLVRRREELAARYDGLLGIVPGIALPPRIAGRRSAWHLYVIAVSPEFEWTGDELIDALRAEGIQATRHYPAVPLLDYYRRLGYGPGTSPEAEKLVPNLVTLPLFPMMSEADQDDVVAAIERLHAWRSRAGVAAQPAREQG